MQIQLISDNKIQKGKDLHSRGVVIVHGDPLK